MFARVSIYGIILAALLMTACSQNETELKSVPEREPVPISFSFTSTQDNQATTRSEFTDTKLRSTGFGVFATVEGSEIPNLMYNQQVTYTYLADDNYQIDGQAQNGYWSYSPIKYWPMRDDNLAQKVTFCAYSPYTEPADIVGATAGITSISNNSQAPYLIYKRYTNPNDSLNLLWDCQTPMTPGTIKLKMRHVLARVAVSIKLDHAPAANTKVLVRRVTLTGNIAESGKLTLAGVVANFIGTSSTEITDGGTEIPTIDGYSGTAKTPGNVVLYLDKEYIWTGSVWQAGVVPKWENQDEKSITLYIDCDPEAEESTASWGILDNNIRYVKDLPYSWQPAGLNATDYQNVITIGGHRGFLYMIPQDNLTLNCSVAYTILSSDGTIETGEKVHNDKVVASPLNGNNTYNLQLRLNL